MKQLISFEEEVRNDFVVNSIRKKLWNIELNIYNEFSRICNKYNLNHFLIYGAALGAIRHKGFIPWDDDIDIGMLRDDFNKLLEVIDIELTEDYSSTYGVLKSTISPLLRIRHKHSTGILKQDIGSKHNKGVFIEIYVIDDVPENKNIRDAQINEIETLMYYANFKQKREIKFTKDNLTTWLRLFGKNSQNLWDKAVNVCRKYNNEKLVNVVQLPIYARKNALLINKADAKNIIEVDFESIKVRVMHNPIHLQQAYGDYMQLPPVAQRGTHHDKIVFYDPDKPYDFYEKSSLVEEYFNGDFEGFI